MFEEFKLIFNELIGVDPSNLWRRFITGSIIITASGIISYAAIFYSFYVAFNTATLFCKIPGDAESLMSSLFMFPLIIVGLYAALVAAIIYYVNPWERIK